MRFASLPAGKRTWPRDTDSCDHCGCANGSGDTLQGGRGAQVFNLSLKPRPPLIVPNMNYSMTSSTQNAILMSKPSMLESPIDQHLEPFRA